MRIQMYDKIEKKVPQFKTTPDDGKRKFIFLMSQENVNVTKNSCLT